MEGSKAENACTCCLHRAATLSPELRPGRGWSSLVAWQGQSVVTEDWILPISAAPSFPPLHHLIFCALETQTVYSFMESLPLLVFVSLWNALPTRLHLQVYSSLTTCNHHRFWEDFPEPILGALPFCWLNTLAEP